MIRHYRNHNITKVFTKSVVQEGSIVVKERLVSSEFKIKPAFLLQRFYIKAFTFWRQEAALLFARMIKQVHLPINSELLGINLPLEPPSALSANSEVTLRPVYFLFLQSCRPLHSISKTRKLFGESLLTASGAAVVTTATEDDDIKGDRYRSFAFWSFSIGWPAGGVEWWVSVTEQMRSRWFIYVRLHCLL